MTTAGRPLCLPSAIQAECAFLQTLINLYQFVLTALNPGFFVTMALDRAVGATKCGEAG